MDKTVSDLLKRITILEKYLGRTTGSSKFETYRRDYAILEVLPDGTAKIVDWLESHHNGDLFDERETYLSVQETVSELSKIEARYKEIAMLKYLREEEEKRERLAKEWVTNMVDKKMEEMK